MLRIARRTTTVALATAAITLGAVGVASASQPGGDETCPAGHFCVYYNSWEYGWGSFVAYPQVPGPWGETMSGTFPDDGNGSGWGYNVYQDVGAFVNNTGISWEMCTADFNHCEIYTPGEAGDVSPSIHNANAYISE